MKTIIIIAATLFQFCTSDLLRTVYCANKCNDYLKVPEVNIPQCQEKHLLLNQCGTVISCSWTDVEVEKGRRMANSTEDIVCCYSVFLKENGDCDSQQTSTTSTQDQYTSKNTVDCSATTSQLMGLLLFLFVLIFIQAIYIIWSIYKKQEERTHKLGHLEEISTVRPIPMFQPRPICETKLLSHMEY